MRFIKEQTVPQKIDCVQCLDAEPGALRSRSWKGVKDYIRNRITALQSGRKRRDPPASVSSKTKKQRAAPNRRKGGVNEAVQGRGLQQYNTQISSQGNIYVIYVVISDVKDCPNSLFTLILNLVLTLQMS